MAKTAIQYKQLLKSLFPNGRAWNKDAESIIDQYCYALAEEFKRIDDRQIDLKNESHVSTALELLSEHEVDYDLTSTGLTTTERRQQLLSKLLSTGGLFKSYYIDILYALGYEIDITEYTPCWVDVATIGSTVGDQNIIFLFTVDVDASFYHSHDHATSDGLDLYYGLDLIQDGIIFDKSVNNNHGTPYGISITELEYKKWSLFSHASSNYIVSQFNNFDTDTGWSISFWMHKSSAVTAGEEVLFSFYKDATHHFEISIREIERDIYTHHINGAYDKNEVTSVIINDDNVHHIVIKYSAITAYGRITSSIYIDNVLISSSIYTINYINDFSISSITNIGSINNGSQCYDGLLKDLRIYNRALTELEISNIYNSYVPDIDIYDISLCQNRTRKLDSIIDAIRPIKPAYMSDQYRFIGVEYSSAFNCNFYNIPPNDDTILFEQFGWDFSTAFAANHEYDGTYLIGSYSQGFNLAFDAHFGGAFQNDTFDTGFLRPI